jgi:hypothetical protein
MEACGINDDTDRLLLLLLTVVDDDASPPPRGIPCTFERFRCDDDDDKNDGLGNVTAAFTIVTSKSSKDVILIRCSCLIIIFFPKL